MRRISEDQVRVVTLGGKGVLLVVAPGFGLIQALFGGGSAMKIILHKITVVMALACIAATMFALPAVAASKHSISGTCRSDAMWYVSTLDRKVPSANTAIRASFYDLCVRSVYFKLINASTGGQFGSTIVASGDVQTLASGVKAGTLFNNAFRLSTTCRFWEDRNFAGYQWY